MHLSSSTASQPYACKTQSLRNNDDGTNAVTSNFVTRTETHDGAGGHLNTVLERTPRVGSEKSGITCSLESNDFTNPCDSAHVWSGHIGNREFGSFLDQNRYILHL